MQGTRSSSSSVFLSVVDVEDVETATLGGIVAFQMADIALDMAQVLRCLVFFRYLGSIDPGGWIASSMASLATALVLLGSLDLRLISGGGGVVGLSLVLDLGDLALGLSVGILLVFFGRRAMALRAPGINVPNVEGRLQVSLCLCITCLLHNFFPAI